MCDYKLHMRLMRKRVIHATSSHSKLLSKKWGWSSQYNLKLLIYKNLCNIICLWFNFFHNIHTFVLIFFYRYFLIYSFELSFFNNLSLDSCIVKVLIYNRRYFVEIHGFRIGGNSISLLLLIRKLLKAESKSK